MIATDGKTTVVDHNDYNLTVYEAVQKLMNNEKVIALEYPDDQQEELYNVYPDPEVLDGNDYKDMDYPEIFEALSPYEQFGIYL